MNRKKYFAKKARDKTSRYRLKRIFVDSLGGKCIDCGYSAHLAALDFDHVNPKEKKFSVAQLLSSGDIDTLTEEVKKCVIRCANCHRIKTNPQATD